MLESLRLRSYNASPLDVGILTTTFLAFSTVFPMIPLEFLSDIFYKHFQLPASTALLFYFISYEWNTHFFSVTSTSNYAFRYVKNSIEVIEIVGF